MGTTRRKFCIGIGVALASSAAAFAIPPVRRLFHPIVLSLRGKRTVDDRLREFSAAQTRVRAACSENGIAFPPPRVVLLGLKHERRLEVYAGSRDGPLRLLHSYPIQAASGVLGPKLREGDRQVPEGVYALQSLNPNSRFHAALRVGYPNELDVSLALREGRTQLGGDIMIHGGAASVGCLAMGDPAIEDLFVLTAAAGIGNVTIVLSPVDLRITPLPAELRDVGDARYSAIRSALSGLAR
jgi:hypothetical protein